MRKLFQPCPPAWLLALYPGQTVFLMALPVWPAGKGGMPIFSGAGAAPGAMGILDTQCSDDAACRHAATMAAGLVNTAK